jgi:ribonuclease Z
MARMILLGVGTGVPDADREHTHMVWDGPGGPLLIDAGGSTYQRLLKAGIDPQSLAGVVLTHSHPDHIHGLAPLMFSIGLAGRRDPLPIYGLAETLAMAEAIGAAMELDYSYVVPPVWQILHAGETIPLAEGWQIRTTLTVHSRPCIALRFEDAASGAALTYSADTEPCGAVQELATGAQVLIHEATTPEPYAGHTSPAQAGAIAAATGVARLILVHFSPRYTMSVAQALAEVAAAGFAGRAEVGVEGQIIDVNALG